MSRTKGAKNKAPRRTDAVIHVYAGADLKAWVARVGLKGKGESDAVVAILEAARDGRPWKDALKERAR